MQVTETPDKLLDAALHLMLSRGYAGTTVDDICTEAGVSKGSFYHFYKTKEELALATLERFYRRGANEFWNGEFRALEDPLDRAFGFVRNTEEHAEFLWREGCLLGSFATELADSNPAMQKAVSKLFRDITEGMAEFLGPVAERAGPDGPSAEQLADMFLEILEGSILLAKAYKDPSRIAVSAARFGDYLRRLIR